MIFRREKWLPIKGWPYQVSDRGRVRKNEESRGRLLLTQRMMASGYMYVTLLNGKRRKHGTDISGDRHHMAKIKAADIPTIRQLIASGIVYIDIAKRYGVTAGSISHIKNGRSWTHVPE